MCLFLVFQLLQECLQFKDTLKAFDDNKNKEKSVRNIGSWHVKV